MSNLNKWHEKIEIVKGNCEKPYYDMEPSDWCRLQTEVNVIFHVAATIRFDEHIKISYNTNVSGTKNLLKLAEKAPNLSVSIYFFQLHFNNICVEILSVIAIRNCVPCCLIRANPVDRESSKLIDERMCLTISAKTRETVWNVIRIVVGVKI